MRSMSCDMCINYMLNNVILPYKRHFHKPNVVHQILVVYNFIRIYPGCDIICSHIFCGVWKIAYVLRLCCWIVVIVRFSFERRKFMFVLSMYLPVTSRGVAHPIRNICFANVSTFIYVLFICNFVQI